MAEQFIPAVQQEATSLLEKVDEAGGTLDYDTFYNAWFRMVNRVVLGDSFRDDFELIELMETQRARGNWAFFRPVDKKARQPSRCHSGSSPSTPREWPASGHWP